MGVSTAARAVALSPYRRRRHLVDGGEDLGGRAVDVLVGVELQERGWKPSQAEQRVAREGSER